MKYKAILFDLDYTLVDATNGIIKCVNYALDKLGRKCSEDKIIKSIGLSFSDTYKFLTNNNNNKNIAYYQEFFLLKAKSCLTDNTKLFDYSVFTLKYIKFNNIKLGLVTSKFRAEVIELLESHNLNNIFDVIIAGDDTENHKPHPEPIIKALEALSTPKTETLYIGDSIIDLKACKASGVNFIGVTTGTTTKNDFYNEKHFNIIDSLQDLIVNNLTTTISTYTLLEDIQKIINSHIMHVGGYWPPEFGLARLIEEIGELFSCSENVSKELPDVFIISICIANQYCANLYKTIKLNSFHQSLDYNDCLKRLVMVTGELARTINSYEGLKTPKENEQINSIEYLITKLIVIIFNISSIKKINIYKETIAKINFAKNRDKNRFKKSYDPCASLAAINFKKIQRNTPCVYAKNSKIWGAPNWNEKLSLSENVINLIPHLKRFTKISKLEEIDVFVISAPDHYGKDIKGLSLFLKNLLNEIAKKDNIFNCMEQEIECPSWQFSFNNTRLFITTFAPCYDKSNSRYNYNLPSTFIVFQPESSFANNKIPRGIDSTARKKIRINFEKNGQPYYNNIIKSNLEATRYIKPLDINGETIDWWK